MWNDKKTSLESEEHINGTLMWFFEAWHKLLDINSESAHDESDAHIKLNIKIRMNDDLTDKVSKIDEPENYQLDNVVLKLLYIVCKIPRIYLYICIYSKRLEEQKHPTWHF